MKKFRPEAHRGMGTGFPENAMNVFAAVGADQKFTAGSRCVVLHDGARKL